MTLSELIERVEKLDGPDEAVDAEICVALQYGGKNSEHAANVRTDPDWSGDLLFEIGNMDCCNPVPELTSSLDAAVALTERVLPGCRMELTTSGYKPGTSLITAAGTFGAYGSTIPIALILATLRALSAQEMGKEPQP